MSTAVIPEPIEQLRHQLDEFRSTQPRPRKLPESLWQAAVELAREHGVYSVAHPLRLDYMGLKKRLGRVSRLRRKASKPAFVELIAPHAVTLRECVIEFESWRQHLPPEAPVSKKAKFFGIPPSSALTAPPFFGGAPLVSRVERNRGLGRAFEKAVRRKPLARRTRALCKLNGARERC
jgi:hypothetical protein